MRLTWLTVSLLSVLVSTAAVAAPLKIRGGETVRVRLGKRAQAGVGLRTKDGTWRLAVPGVTGTAELSDITDGAMGAKWRVSVEDGNLVLDAGRFVAGHAYRVTLAGAEAVVYLYPPKQLAAQRVRFATEEPPAGLADAFDGIAVTPKSAL